jgi:hypothetical protein
VANSKNRIVIIMRRASTLALRTLAAARSLRVGVPTTIVCPRGLRLHLTRGLLGGGEDLPAAVLCTTAARRPPPLPRPHPRLSGSLATSCHKDAESVVDDGGFGWRRVDLVGVGPQSSRGEGL